MLELSTSELNLAAAYMDNGLLLKRRNTSLLFGDRLSRTYDLADWVTTRIRTTYNDQIPQLNNGLVNSLYLAAKQDKPLKQQVGSVWLMLLGNLAIQLFIHWLQKRRNET